MRELGRWLQPQHLQPSSIRSYSASLRSHPGHLVVLTDFLVPDVADILARFLLEEAGYETEHGLYSTGGTVEEGRWAEANDADRLFRRARVHRATSALSPGALIYLELRRAFTQRPVKQFFERITGCRLGAARGFAGCVMAGGDFFHPHSIDARHCRLAITLHLSKTWQPELGGELRVMDPYERVTKVGALYNSMVLLEGGPEMTWMVSPIRSGPGVAVRVTFEGLYEPWAAPGQAGITPDGS